MSEVFDDTACELGEGPLWHPGRGQLFWFDVLRHRLHTREGGRTRTVQFAEHVSAAGWVDASRLLIASETRLFLFDLERETSEDVAPLEPDDPATRCNDGRADPWGGFWIGTMAKAKANGAGAIYRYYRGEVRRLHANVSIPNAICFPPGRRFAHFADTPTSRIMRQRLDPEDGWPTGEPEPWVDLSAEGLHPDGAVVDAGGNLWNAQWGAWRVACYDPDGGFVRAVGFDAAHTSCPAFGGPDFTTLFCTSAKENQSDADRARSRCHGMTLAAQGVAIGQPEPRVIL